MTQADRDRLVTLKKAKKRLITQREAAEELGISIRQVKRLLYALKKHGDKAVIHGLRGRPTHRRIEESLEREAVKILAAPGGTRGSGRGAGGEQEEFGRGRSCR
jgi:predicted ArsR family transcriptional regulator